MFPGLLAESVEAKQHQRQAATAVVRVLCCKLRYCHSMFGIVLHVLLSSGVLARQGSALLSAVLAADSMSTGRNVEAAADTAGDVTQ